MRLQSNFVILSSIACASLVSVSASVNGIFGRDIASPSFVLEFSGTGTSYSDRDASVGGPGYKTFKFLDDKTYDIKSCLDFCANDRGCVFANLFYERNIPMDERSTNLKCALYDRVHTASSKTNWGGQQRFAEPAGRSFVQFSTGWSALDVNAYTGQGFTAPATPAEIPGFELVFDLQDAYVDAPGLLNYYLMKDYNTQACADLCVLSPRDPVTGECRYFNIVTYAAKDESVAVHYCITYSIPPNQSFLLPLGAESTEFHLKNSRAYSLT